MSRPIGPSLPPGFASRSSSEEEESDREPTGPERDYFPPSSKTADSAHSSLGPQIGPGPRVPPQFEPPGGNGATENVTCSFGPALPPEFQTRRSPSPSEKNLGPTLPPPHSMPNHTQSGSDSSDEELIGPMPSSSSSQADLLTKRHKIESRSQAMKDKLLGKDSKEAAGPKREEWMIELPSGYKPLGIGARKFRTRAPEGGDRSVWTDTPEDKRRKAEEALSGHGRKEQAVKGKGKERRKLASVVAKEEALAKQVEEYNKEHRSQSLTDMHRKRRKEVLKEKGGVSERRPFDRERDLEAPRSLVTPAKRMALTKDSKFSLDSKFQRGSRSFL